MFTPLENFQHLTFVLFYMVKILSFQRVTIYQVGISAYVMDLWPRPSVGLCVCVCRSVLSVCPESVLWQNSWLDPDAVGMLSGVGQGMGVLHEVGDHQRGRGSFGDEFGVSHCNQLGICCIVVQKCMQQSSCHWGRSMCPKQKGWFWGFGVSISLNGVFL